MKKKCCRFLVPIALIILVIVIAKFLRPSNINIPVVDKIFETTMSPSEVEELEKLAQEKERIEREERERELERLRLEEEKKLKEATRFVLKAETPVYSSASTDSTQNSIVLERKQAVYVVSETEGFTQISTDYKGSPVGYVSTEALVSEITDFIAKPIADVDYSPFTKNADFPDNPRIKVKGVYVTGNTAKGDKMDAIINLINKSDLNSVVIDVKDDNDYMLFYSETAAKLNPESNKHVYIEDIQSLMKKLKENNIYTIARIVTFKSPIYAEQHPDKAISYKSTGRAFSHRDGLKWSTPHNRELWDYNIGVAIEAAKLGFNEIQFDYVRFPDIYDKTDIDYKAETEESHTAVIQGFLKKAYESLTPYNVYVAADVFGWTATALDDVGIGQHWEALTNVVDYMCPMVYPSHYGKGNFGLTVPDAHPYETIDFAIKDALKRDSNTYTPAIQRPWLQDFTATWVKGHISYGEKELRDQIRALKDNGIDEYLIWNAANRYTEEAFINN